jgi:pimeloyl-ACP methyl ester carboxylesterase
MTERRLVYLHGLAGDLYTTAPDQAWPKFLTSLADGFSVVAPAHPGYDGGPPIDGFDTVEDYVFHYLDLLDELGRDPVVLVGFSLGGWLAAEIALRHPQRIGKLALISPLGMHVSGVQPALFFGAVAPRGIGGMGEARSILFADGDSALANATLPDDMPPEHQLRWFQGLAGAARLGWQAPHFQSRKLRARLRRIEAATLLLWGESDRLVPMQHAQAWQEAIAGSTLVTIPGAGHCLPIEQPERTIEELLAFLGD